MRHLSGLFSGPEETYAVLLPFIAEGLQQGERAVHFVDPAARDSHLETLTRAGIDVERALDAGQLEVDTWEDSYLRGGRFYRQGMVLFLQKAMAEGRSRGYAATRAVGFMEWAVDQVAGVDDVVSYETDLDNALRGAADSVICAYDLSRHSAGLVARLQTAHPLAIIGGRLVPTGARGASPRERLLDAASQLFSSQGIGPTGVDALIDAAGVAKATFYSYFPSKDDLIMAWLGDSRTRWLDRVRQRAEEIAGESDETIAAFFEAVAEWLEAENCRGCPYLNTAVELVDAGHPAQQMIDDYLSEERTYLQDLLMSAPHRAPIAHGGPARLAAELQMLLNGAISLSVARHSSSPAREARDAAIRLVDSAIGERS